MKYTIEVEDGVAAKEAAVARPKAAPLDPAKIVAEMQRRGIKPGADGFYRMRAHPSQVRLVFESGLAPYCSTGEDKSYIESVIAAPPSPLAGAPSAPPSPDGSPVPS